MKTPSPASVIRAMPERSFVRVDRLPGTAAAARKAASRAAAAGELIAIRRGLYYRGRRTRYGMTTPRAEEVARAILGNRGVGPAGYSAARTWGVTTQIPPAWHVATLRTVEMIDGVRQHARRNLARADLNELEIALLELLRAPDIYIETGWADFATKVREAVRTGKVRENELRSAVATEHNVAVRTNFERLENSAMVSVA